MYANIKLMEKCTEMGFEFCRPDVEIVGHLTPTLKDK